MKENVFSFIDVTTIDCICATWLNIEKMTFEFYESLIGSIEIHKKDANLRFKLTSAKRTFEDPFQVIIKEKYDGSFIFKSDYYEKVEDYELWLLKGVDQFLFYTSDEFEEIYFHVYFKNEKESKFNK